MMARRLPTILPDLTLEEAIETTKVFSTAGLTAGEDAAPGDPSFPFAPSYGFRCRTDRRRPDAAARRGVTGPQRSPLSR